MYSTLIAPFVAAAPKVLAAAADVYQRKAALQTIAIHFQDESKQQNSRVR